MSDRAIPDDPALPRLRELFPNRGAPAFIANAAAQILGSRVTARSGEVSYVRYWPGRRCVVQWTFPQPDGRSRIVSAELQPERVDKRRKPGAHHSYIEDRRLLLQAFPYDDGLPGIEGAVSQQWMEGVLAPALSLSPGEASTLRATQVSYKPWRRCVVLYEAESQGSKIRAYGKLFRDDRGADLFARLKVLEGALATRQTGWQVAPFLLYDADLKLLVQAETVGESLSDVVRRAPENEADKQVLFDSLTLAAKGLPGLQQMPIENLETVGPMEMLAALDEDIASIGIVDQDLASDLQRQLERMRRLADRLSPEPYGLSHSAFRLSHIYPSTNGLSLLDLDGVARSGVSSDAGYFLAYLAVTAAERKRLEPVLLEAADVFSDALSENNFSPQWRGFYTYMTVLKWAVRSFFSLDEDWPRRIKDMLDIGRRLLHDAREEGKTDPGAREPLFEMASSPKALFDYAKNQLVSALEPEAALLSIARRETFYTEKEGTVLYADLRLRAPDETRVDKRLILSFKTEPFGADERTAGLPLPWVHGECLVEVFPDDYAVPGLRRAYEREWVSRLLARAGKPTVAQGDDFDVQLLRYRPHERAVLSYEIGGRHYALKAFDDEATALDVWRVLNVLRSQLADPRLIVQPLAVDAESRVLLTEFIEGTSLDRLMDATTDEELSRQYTRRAAETLATLHSLQLESTTVTTLAGIVQKLRAHADDVRAVSPGLAERVHSVLDGVEASAASAPPAGASSLVHGGYKAAQLIDRGDVLTLLDFDGVGIGDPAIDLGRFMAKLRSDSVASKRRHLRFLSEYFAAEYARASGHDLTERARLYEITALARMTTRHIETEPQSLFDPMKKSASNTLLGTAEECLTRL